MERVNSCILNSQAESCWHVSLTKEGSGPGQRSVELLREDYGLVVSLNHRFAFYESVQLSDLNGERFIVRTHCETFGSTTKLLAERGIRSQVVYRTDQDDRALALVGAGMGVALMPAIFDASDVKKSQFATSTQSA